MSILENIESLLFVAGEEGLTIDELSELLEVPQQVIKYNLLRLREDYRRRNTAVTIIVTAKRYKMATKKEYRSLIERFAQSPLQVKLTQAVLETLIIVAYRQPVTRVEIDHIRGVKSHATIQRLLLRGLIREAGRLDKPGRPKLYVTTNYFLDYFGLNTLDELPDLFETVDWETTPSTDLFDQ